MKVAVKNFENKEVGQVDLADAIFGIEVKQDILQRMVHYQLNKRRAGTHKTKGVSEVSGTGKKPWKQKGTGRARFSTLRAPQFKGGAIIFGPVVRSHATDLPKKTRALALKMALAVKAKEGKLIVLDSSKMKEAKTKTVAAAFEKLGFSNALIVDANDFDMNFALSARNIPNIDVLPSDGANVYDILRRDTLVLTQEAVKELTERLGKKEGEKPAAKKEKKAA
ncbi:MAG: 50S ribosomal protein L4 [Alphaproteobacteria bacterium]|nr:50S ribosomal protein L4 [Alphaproteobacteria bacterium]